MTSLLASDMDGTVIPLEDTPRRRAELVEFREAVEESDDLILAYVTGRRLALAEKGMGQFRLPGPDFLVCDVGTSVFRAGPNGFELDGEYARRMRVAMDGVDFKEVRRLLEGIEGLDLQPDERQTEFKLSYHLPGESRPGFAVSAVRARLEGLEGSVQAVYSVGAPSGIGLLDLLPKGAAKDSALRYLKEVTEVEDEHIVYAGDSGNDLAALLAGFNAIVVANAGSELKEELSARELDGADLSRVFFSNHPFAKGVLEGCRHFGML